MSRPSSRNTGQLAISDRARREGGDNKDEGSAARRQSTNDQHGYYFSNISSQQLRAGHAELEAAHADEVRSVPRSKEQRRCAVFNWHQQSGEDGSNDHSVATSRILSTAQELQDFLSNLSVEQETKKSGVFTIQVASRPDLGTSTEYRHPNEEPKRKPLIILQGLNPSFLHILTAAPEIRLDPAFINAHATRRRYRARDSSTSDDSTLAAYWEYPELAIEIDPTLRRYMMSMHTLSGSGAVARSISDQKDVVAVFCRASLWATSRVDVMLLDRPVWTDHGGWLGRYRKNEILWDNSASQWDSITIVVGEETKSLDEELQQDFSSSKGTEGYDFLGVLERLARERWLDLFEELTPRQKTAVYDGKSLEWEILQSLEQNMDMAKALARRNTNSSEPYDWTELLQRLRDRLALLPTLPAATTTPWGKTRRKRATKKAKAQLPLYEAESAAIMPIPRQRNDYSPPTSGGDENQRALDRVTYLGGILLPVSIVSSILSMNEAFEPGQRLFWVFWVAAVPLSKCLYHCTQKHRLLGQGQVHAKDTTLLTTAPKSGAFNHCHLR